MPKIGENSRTESERFLPIGGGERSSVPAERGVADDSRVAPGQIAYVAHLFSVAGNR